MNNNLINQIEEFDVKYTELSDLELEFVSGGKGGGGGGGGDYGDPGDEGITPPASVTGSW
ncbi:MAG: hypothetical protein AB4062_15110 [Crocosphaera sp.]